MSLNDRRHTKAMKPNRLEKIQTNKFTGTSSDKLKISLPLKCIVLCLIPNSQIETKNKT